MSVIASFCNQITELKAENQSLKSQVAELERDRARLDWLFQFPELCATSSSGSIDYSFDFQLEDPREAIDQAMKGPNETIQS